MSGAALVTFNEGASCPKCGCDKILANYRPQESADPLWFSRRYDHCWPEHELIVRRCTRCEYEWAEACKA